MEGLTEGRIVHYCFMTQGELVHRPALVVRVWPHDPGLVNLTLFPDWTNDLVPYTGDQVISVGVIWKTSVKYSEEPKEGTWHWIEKAKATDNYIILLSPPGSQSGGGLRIGEKYYYYISIHQHEEKDNDNG